MSEAISDIGTNSYQKHWNGLHNTALFLSRLTVQIKMVSQKLKLLFSQYLPNSTIFNNNMRINTIMQSAIMSSMNKMNFFFFFQIFKKCFFQNIFWLVEQTRNLDISIFKKQICKSFFYLFHINTLKPIIIIIIILLNSSLKITQNLCSFKQIWKKKNLISNQT